MHLGDPDPARDLCLREVSEEPECHDPTLPFRELVEQRFQGSVKFDMINSGVGRTERLMQRNALPRLGVPQPCPR